MSQHVYRPLDKMDFSELIDVSFTVEGNTDYVKYSNIVNRIRSFEDYEIIGTDTSNQYNIYKIELGTKGKPVIMLSSGVHGTEYAGILYTLGILKDIEDNKLPDSEFRNYLLNNFHIICLPCINPYGVNYTTPYAITRGRANFNGKDINREFARFNELEARIVKKYMDNPEIFAYADNHLIRNHASKPYVVFYGNGQHATNDLRDYGVNSMNAVLDKPTKKWEAFKNMTHGITRRYMRDKINKHTEFTLSYTIELARPVDENASKGGKQRPFDSSKEMYNYGYKITYIFLKSSVQYFDAYNGTGLYKEDNENNVMIESVETPEKDINFEYDENDYVSEIKENYKKGYLKDKTTLSKINRRSDKRVKSIEKELI